MNITNTSHKQRPTFKEYGLLYKEYPEILTCSCKKIAINYEEFVQINYTLHQVCTSVFVTEEWFKYLSYTFPYSDINSDDSQWIGPALFQALDTFCQTANRVISNALTQFYSAQYISAIVTPSHIFTLQTETSIN
ncbi:unnamed protein product, partial [Adineta ricciae]